MVSLHLRRGTPVEEIIDQCAGIQEMQPFFNVLQDGRSVAVLGLGDGIAHILKGHLKAAEERRATQAESEVKAFRMSGPRNGTETGVVSFGGGPFIHLQDT